MATTLAQICAFLDAADCSYHAVPEQGRLVTGFALPNGKSVQVVVAIEEAGKFVKLIAPQVLMLGNHPQREQVLELLAALGMQIRLVRWQYDPSAGEVRAGIDIPLEDAELTPQQLMQNIQALVQI